MLDQQTTTLIIGVLFLFIAYAMQDKQYEQYRMYAFAAIGGLILLRARSDKGGRCL